MPVEELLDKEADFILRTWGDTRRGEAILAVVLDNGEVRTVCLRGVGEDGAVATA